MGVLIKILTKAVLHSLKKGFGKVDEGILEKIANRYGMRYSGSLCNEVHPRNPVF
jgi:hypothetical protein